MVRAYLMITAVSAEVNTAPGRRRWWSDHADFAPWHPWLPARASAPAQRRARDARETRELAETLLREKGKRS